MSIAVKHGLPCYCEMLVPLNDYDDDERESLCNVCEKLYDIWWRNLGSVGRNREETRENRNENGEVYVWCQPT